MFRHASRVTCLYFWIETRWRAVRGPFTWLLIKFQVIVGHCLLCLPLSHVTSWPRVTVCVLTIKGRCSWRVDHLPNWTLRYRLVYWKILVVYVFFSWPMRHLLFVHQPVSCPLIPSWNGDFRVTEFTEFQYVSETIHFNFGVWFERNALKYWGGYGNCSQRWRLLGIWFFFLQLLLWKKSRCSYIF